MCDNCVLTKLVWLQLSHSKILSFMKNIICKIHDKGSCSEYFPTHSNAIWRMSTFAELSISHEIFIQIRIDRQVPSQSEKIIWLRLWFRYAQHCAQLVHHCPKPAYFNFQLKVIWGQHHNSIDDISTSHFPLLRNSKFQLSNCKHAQPILKNRGRLWGLHAWPRV